MRMTQELVGRIDVLLFGFVVACCLFSPLTQAGLRCGTKLANLGDSTSRVSHICGEPEYKQRRSVYRTLGGQVGSAINSVYAEKTIEIVVDEWLYNFGPNRLKQTVIFENGRLESVKNEGYGY